MHVVLKSRILRTVSWLFPWLCVLASPFCVAILILCDAWPMIPITVVWPFVATQFLPFRWFDPYSRAIFGAVYLFFLVIMFAPAVFATFFYGPIPGEAVVILLFATWIIVGWCKGHAGRKEAHAENERLRGWLCPHCGESFGQDSLLVRYGASRRSHPNPETHSPHVILRCSHCKYGYTFRYPDFGEFQVGPDSTTGTLGMV